MQAPSAKPLPVVVCEVWAFCAIRIEVCFTLVVEMFSYVLGELGFVVLSMITRSTWPPMIALLYQAGHDIAVTPMVLGSYVLGVWVGLCVCLCWRERERERWVGG